MKFRNQRDHALDFELDAKRYIVDAFGTVEIPDRVAYCVALHGLPLSEDVTVEPMPEPTPESTDKPTRKKN